MDTVSSLTPPVQPATTEEVALLDVLNNNWQHWGYKWEQYVSNPDTIPLAEYEKMLQTDESVFAGAEYLVQSVIARIGEYCHPDEVIQEEIRTQLAGMDGSWLQAVGEIASALFYGYSVTEKVYKIDAGMVRLKTLQTLHPSTTVIETWKDGPDKNRPKVVHQFWGDTEHVVLPVDKCILYNHGGTFGNVYGTSRLKRAWKNWFIKEVLLKAWGTSLERHGKPTTIGYGDLSGTVQDQNGRQVQKAAYLNSVIKKIFSDGVGVLDGSTKVEISRAAAGIGKDFSELIAYLNRSIHQAIGLPALTLDVGSSGAYSLGKEQGDRFNQLLEGILIELTDMLVEQLIRPLIEMNFGQQDTYGCFSFEEWVVEDQKVVADTFSVLIASGILSVDRVEDMNWMRERLGLELLDESEIDALFPQMPSNPLAQSLDPIDTASIETGTPVENSFQAVGKMRRRLASNRQVLIAQRAKRAKETV